MSENALPTSEPASDSPILAAPAAPSAGHALGIVAVVLGGLFLLSGLCGLLAYALVPLRRTSGALSTNTLVASATAIALVYGSLLLLAGLPGLRRAPWPHLQLGRAWVWIVLFILAISLGQLVLRFGAAPAYLFPPWHVLAAGLVPLAVLAYASRRLPGASAPSVFAEIAWGGVGTVLLAIVAEFLVIALFAVFAALGSMVLLGGPQGLQQLLSQLQFAVRANPDPQRLIEILQGQPVLLLLVGALVILFLSLAVPLIEELLKALGPAAAIARARPTASRALLWGLAAGAGYAFSENLLNGAQGATSDVSGSFWWALMALRAGTSLVHIAGTATISIGWWHVFVRGAHGRIVLFLLAAIAAHGFWNLIAVIMGGALGQANLGSSGSRTGALIFVLALSILLFLLLAAAAWIAWLVRWAGRQDRRPS